MPETVRLLRCEHCRKWAPRDLLSNTGTCPDHPERVVLRIEKACELIDEVSLPEKVARREAVPV